MRNIAISVFTLILLLGAPLNSRAEVNIGISADQDGIKEFHLSIGSHYGVKEVEIELVRARRLPDDEMTVVFFISNRASVSPLKIADLRLRGLSWMEISLKFGFGADIYYVAFASDPGPPYGKAWGHFKKKPKKQWHKIKLVDADIVNLVNLKFLSERHGYPPEKIVRMKKQGKSFAGMHGEFKKAKAQKKRAKAPKTAKGKKTKAKKGKR